MKIRALFVKAIIAILLINLVLPISASSADVAAPDLVITEVGITEKEYNLGDEVHFYAVIKNIGNVAAPKHNYVVEFLLNTPEVKENVDKRWYNRLGKSSYETCAVMFKGEAFALAPGESIIVVSNVTNTRNYWIEGRDGAVKLEYGGKNSVLGIVDTAGILYYRERTRLNNAMLEYFNVGETEDDNTESGLVKLSDGLDIIIEEVGIVEEDYKAGDFVTFYCVIRNMGDRPLPLNTYITHFTMGYKTASEHDGRWWVRSSSSSDYTHHTSAALAFSLEPGKTKKIVATNTRSADYGVDGKCKLIEDDSVDVVAVFDIKGVVRSAELSRTNNVGYRQFKLDISHLSGMAETTDTRPLVLSVNQTDGLVYEDEVEISGCGNKTLSSLNIDVNGEQFLELKKIREFNVKVPVVQGMNEVSITAADSMGHKETKTLKLTLDKNMPKIELDNMTASTQRPVYELSGTLSSVCNININVNNMEYSLPSGDSFAQTVDLIPGENIITVSAEDVETGRKAVIKRTVQYVPQADWEWKNIPTKVMGLSQLLQFHPKEDLMYMTSDVGGLYLYDKEKQSWTNLWGNKTKLSVRFESGIDALGLDPNNPDVLYIAAGMYTGSSYEPGTIYKSTDRGKTWTPLNSQFRWGANEIRTPEDRIAVDPFNSDIVYAGTRQDGLWRSMDAGETWNLVEDVDFIPGQTDYRGVMGIMFDPNRKGVVYVISFDVGIYKSEDGGETWAKMGGEKTPKKIYGMTLDSDGILYISCNEETLLKWTSAGWKDISPTKGLGSRAGAVRVDPFDNLHIVMNLFTPSNRVELYESRDGGATWRNVNNVKLTNRTSQTNFWSTSHNLRFDPYRKGRLWRLGSTGAWYTDDLSADPVELTAVREGMNAMTTMCVLTRPDTTDLLIGAADAGMFLYEDYDTIPETAIRLKNRTLEYNIWDIDYCHSQPENIVRAAFQSRVTGRPSISTDGGKTWQWTAKDYYGVSGLPLKVAMSSTDPNVFIVIYQGRRPARTADGGQTWEMVKSLPRGTTATWYRDNPIAADRVNGNIFYYYDTVAGNFYRSEDAGATFKLVNSLPRGSYNYIKASFENEKEIWLSTDRNGLYYSKDGGDNFIRMQAFNRAFTVGFGDSDVTGKCDRVYVYGQIGELEGLFASDNQGASWYRISNEEYVMGNLPGQLTGSKTGEITVFLGTDGRGVFYGRPKPTVQIKPE